MYYCCRNAVSVVRLHTYGYSIAGALLPYTLLGANQSVFSQVGVLLHFRRSSSKVPSCWNKLTSKRSTRLTPIAGLAVAETRRKLRQYELTPSDRRNVLASNLCSTVFESWITIFGMVGLHSNVKKLRIGPSFIFLRIFTNFTFFFRQLWP